MDAALVTMTGKGKGKVKLIDPAQKTATNGAALLVVEIVGETSNLDLQKTFEILEEWEAHLQAENIDFEELSL